MRRCAGVVVALALGVGAASLSHAAFEFQESATTYVQAAGAQLAKGDYTGAIGSYSRAIDIIEQGAGALSIDLVQPLTGLANAQRASQQHQLAAETLRRAIGVLRRGAGLYDPRQYPLLIQLVDLHSELGELDAAADGLQYLQRLSANTHTDGSVEQAGSMSEIADWQCRIGQFEEGRRLHRKAIDALDGGTQPEPLIKALVRMAHCCLHQLSAEGIASAPGVFEQYRGPIARSGRMTPDNPAFRFHGLKLLGAEGEQALLRAVKLADKTLDAGERIAVLLEAGDWFQMKDHTRAARRYYAKAESLATRTGAGPDHALSAPVRLFFPHPASALRRPHAAETLERFVEVEFTVRADGRVDDERVLNRDAGKSLVDETLSALHAARFRPRVVAGRAVDTKGVRYRQVFLETK
ncbi:MAG: energy transducer TonB [Steroidobacter sp.]